MSNSSKEKRDEYFYKIYGALTDIINNEDSDFYIDMDEVVESDTATELIHAMSTMAPAVVYSQLTGADTDILGFNQTMNRLIQQFNIQDQKK